MPVLNHAHCYERSKSDLETYRCVHPKCMHYIKRELIIGKEITCAKCHELTIARQEQLKAGQKKAGTKVLTCLYCSNSAKKETLIKYDNVLEDLFKDVS